MKRFVRWVGLLLSVALVVLVIGVLTGKTAGERKTPIGLKRNTARYLVMRDSVRIAVDLWLPASVAAGQRVPTVVNATRYVRATAAGPLLRWAQRLTRANDADSDVDGFNGAGYAVVKVDARGSGASTGRREIEWSPDEVADYGEVVDWIVAQPWSNGKVGAFGVSYEGNTAELFAATERSAVKAVAPLFDDFDPSVNIAFMGGVLNEDFIRQWGAANNALDRSDFCSLAGLTGIKCRAMGLVMGGIKPVDEDHGGRELGRILAERKNYDVLSALQGVVSPRDTFAGTSQTLVSVAPAGLRAKIERFNTPMLIRLGWIDGGTVTVGLSRFLTFKNPQQVEVGPWSHGGGYHVDPFLPDSTPTEPSSRAQFEQMVAFFDRHLKDAPRDSAARRDITYYTMNDGRWRTTTQWPPAGMTSVRWYFDTAGTLGTAAPAKDTGADRYTVDTTASTGRRGTRWHTQLGGGDVIYPDRASEDKKLLTYTSAPLDRDIEISGVPIVSLHVASTHTDGGFFAYLESVAPNGRVTYITEGMLRALHRRESPAPPLYYQFGPNRSYLSADTLPLVPGETTPLRFELFATSVRVTAGHRLRVALAGADRPNLGLYPPRTAPTWTVFRSPKSPSFIELQMADAKPQGESR